MWRWLLSPSARLEEQGWVEIHASWLFIAANFAAHAAARSASDPAASAMCRAAGYIPAGMELFAVGDESQMETIKRWIDASDIYMLILGGRYGSVEPKTGMSYVELEYDYAISVSKPVFTVVIRDDALDAKVRQCGKCVLETERSQEYKAFRQKVLERTCAFFTDAKDIRLAVHETLPDIQNRYELAGWVSAADVPDTKVLVAEITRLSEENENVRQENRRLQKSLKSRRVSSLKDEDLENLIALLAKIEIESTIFGKDGKAARVPLLSIFVAAKDQLVTGVTNHYEMRDEDRLLYFNVCPKL